MYKSNEVSSHETMLSVAKQRRKSDILSLIGHKETMIMIYDKRDQVRTSELQAELVSLNAELVEIMTLENEFFLEASKGA